VLERFARPWLQGKQLVFVTNNSTKSRAGYLGKFTSLGLSIAADEIYSSSYAAAAYLEAINFPKDKKVQDQLEGFHTITVILQQ
jgi:ribonucleotide monophosphatase NagD (HAD superfamily)